MNEHVHPMVIRGDTNFWIKRMLRYKSYFYSSPYWESAITYHTTAYTVHHHNTFKFPIEE